MDTPSSPAERLAQFAEVVRNRRAGWLGAPDNDIYDDTYDDTSTGVAADPRRVDRPDDRGAHAGRHHGPGPRGWHGGHDRGRRHGPGFGPGGFRPDGFGPGDFRRMAAMRGMFDGPDGDDRRGDLRHGPRGDRGGFGPGGFGRGGFGRGPGRGFGPGGFGPGGPGGRERFFERGELRYVILDLVSETPRHGYDIIRELEDQFEGLYSPSPGSVYPTLQMMEDQGLVTSSERDGKKVYQATDEGRKLLDERSDLLDTIRERVASRGEFRALAAVRPLVGDLWQLGQTIFHATAEGAHDKERIEQLREIIARTRAEIEHVLAQAPADEPKPDTASDATPDESTTTS